jgi:hypothetical protein
MDISKRVNAVTQEIYIFHILYSLILSCQTRNMYLLVLLQNISFLTNIFIGFIIY